MYQVILERKRKENKEIRISVDKRNKKVIDKDLEENIANLIWHKVGLTDTIAKIKKLKKHNLSYELLIKLEELEKLAIGIDNENYK